MAEENFKPHFFERQDNAPDTAFYREPRLLVHIDDFAIAAARDLYAELLPKNAAILDLMSSYRSHMPSALAWTRLSGLGLNEEELRQNDQLTDWVVHDLNADPRMPYEDGEFDGAVVTVSIQYMTRPLEVFRDVRRVLKPGSPFIVTYSNEYIGFIKGLRGLRRCAAALHRARQARAERLHRDSTASCATNA